MKLKFILVALILSVSACVNASASSASFNANNQNSIETNSETCNDCYNNLIQQDTIQINNKTNNMPTLLATNAANKKDYRRAIKLVEDDNDKEPIHREELLIYNKHKFEVSYFKSKKAFIDYKQSPEYEGADKAYLIINVVDKILSNPKYPVRCICISPTIDSIYSNSFKSKYIGRLEEFRISCDICGRSIIPENIELTSENKDLVDGKANNPMCVKRSFKWGVVECHDSDLLELYITSKTVLTRNMLKECYADFAKYLSIVGNIKEIAPGAFEGFKLLKTVNLPESVECIGERAFKDCSELKFIYLPKNADKIEDSAFKNCPNLYFANLNEGLKIIDKHAFEGCSNMRRVALPNSIAQVSDDSFANCTKLVCIKCPEHMVTWINNSYGVINPRHKSKPVFIKYKPKGSDSVVYDVRFDGQQNSPERDEKEFLPESIFIPIKVHKKH